MAESAWMYNPSYPLAMIGTIVYGLIFIAISYMTLIKYRAWYFIPVVIGAGIEVASYALRTYSTREQSLIAPMAATLTLNVLAPVFIAAGNYMLISRLILAVLPPSRQHVLKIPGRRLTPIFVVCDIIAFLVQGSGSSISSADNWTGETERIGRYVLIGGLSFQLVAFGLFLGVFRRFHVLGNRYETKDSPKDWRRLVFAVYVSSLLIMVRCIFRVCEFAEGMEGYAFLNEWLFWVFEALPMAPAIAIFCFIHPSKYLGKYGAWKLQQFTKMEESTDTVDV